MRYFKKKKSKRWWERERSVVPGQITVLGLPFISEVEFIRPSVLLAVKLPSDMWAQCWVIHRIWFIYHPTPFIYITLSFSFSHFSFCQTHSTRKYHSNTHQNAGPPLNPKPHLCLFPEKDSDRFTRKRCIYINMHIEREGICGGVGKIKSLITWSALSHILIVNFLSFIVLSFSFIICLLQLWFYIYGIFKFFYISHETHDKQLVWRGRLFFKKFLVDLLLVIVLSHNLMKE